MLSFFPFFASICIYCSVFNRYLRVSELSRVLSAVTFGCWFPCEHMINPHPPLFRYPFRSGFPCSCHDFSTSSSFYKQWLVGRLQHCIQVMGTVHPAASLSGYGQWFSPSRMLRPFNTAPQVVVVTWSSLLLYSCNVAAVMKHMSISDRWPLWKDCLTPTGVVTTAWESLLQRLCLVREVPGTCGFQCESRKSREEVLRLVWGKLLGEADVGFRPWEVGFVGRVPSDILTAVSEWLGNDRTLILMCRLGFVSLPLSCSSVPNQAPQPSNWVQFWVWLAWCEGHTWRIKMTLRAPFCEGVEGPHHFPEPKSVDNLFRSFSVAFGLDYFVTSVLLAVRQETTCCFLLTTKAGE